MTDITGSYSKIQQEEVTTKSAASEFTMTKIGAAINAIIDGGAHPLGTVLSSILTTAQFQGIMGSNWVRIAEAGTSLVGTDLEALTGISSILSLPEGYGLTNGANSSLSSITSGTIKSHTHTSSFGVSNSLNAGSSLGIGPSYPLSVTKQQTLTMPVSVSTEGTSGNLSASIKVNFFMKVNV